MPQLKPLATGQWFFLLFLAPRVGRPSSICLPHPLSPRADIGSIDKKI
jgi:hypothetical protein